MGRASNQRFLVCRHDVLITSHVVIVGLEASLGQEAMNCTLHTVCQCVYCTYILIIVLLFIYINLQHTILYL